MRLYIGSPDRDQVWVTHRPDHGQQDLNALLAELQQLPPADARHAALLDSILELDRQPGPQPLHHRDTGRTDGLRWGTHDDAGTALAAAILAHETGETPTTQLADTFRDAVLARVDSTEQLELPATTIWHWIDQNRLLVEAELFNNAPQLHPAAPEHERTIPQVPPPTASDLVAACEQAWDAIRSHHPQLPEAVIVVGSGVEQGRLVKLGHWWGGRWIADGQSRGEVLLAGEALHQQPAEVFEILLHEAAHALNAARGIKDTSRGGRYHNQRFQAAAQEVLLKVRAMPPYGLARTLLTDEARDRYETTIDRLGDAMRIARRLDPPTRSREGTQAEGEGQTTEHAKTQAVTCTCGCGRRLRMAPTVLASGPVSCGVCQTDFTPTKQVEAPRAVIDNDQRSRIEAALDRALRSVDLVPLPLDLPPPSGPLAELSTLAATPGELTVLVQWYRDLGGPDETPMPATTTEQARRLDTLARSVLAADGTLAGPELEHPNTRRRYQAGDRVIVTTDNDAEIDPGTLGTIEAVDPIEGLLRVDFPTAGRLEARVDEAIAAALDHDYTTLQAAEADIGVELGL